MFNLFIGNYKHQFYNANPALWFSLVYLFLMGSITLLFWDRFSFEGANLFTFIWTFMVLLAVHTTINGRRYFAFWKQEHKKEILKSYGHATYHYIPYFLVAIVYEHIFLFRSAFADTFPLIDLELMEIDEAIFGIQPTIWLEKFIVPFAVDYFMVAYALFLIYPYFYLIYLYQKNALTVMHRVMLAQVLSLIFALSMFITLPAQGPRYTLDANMNAHINGKNLPTYSMPLKGVQLNTLESWFGKSSLFELQYDFWNQIERIKSDCMPSMHTCLCLIVLIYAIRYRHMFKYKKLAMSFWIIGNLSLFFSTVYLRYHWVADVIIGAILAISMYYVTEYFYKYWLVKRTDYGLTKPPQVEWILKAEQMKRNKVS